MKTVFTNAELPHIWAHRSQSEGRTANRNLYFDGDTIYSYGGHFPIARHVEHNGKRFVFFTSQSYSVTTSAHCSRVRQAIPNALPVFYVDDPRWTPRQAFAAMHENACRMIGEVKRARNVISREKRAAELMREIRRFNAFAEYFGYVKRMEPDSSWVELENGHRERETQRELRCNERRAQRSSECSAAWEAGRVAREKRLEQWRNGDDLPNYGFHDLPVAVRINGDIVETSLGARFPLEHARRAAPLVKRLLERGETFHANGLSIHLGHYNVDAIDADGTLHAGCHHVGRAELVRLIDQLEMVTA